MPPFAQNCSDGGGGGLERFIDGDGSGGGYAGGGGGYDERMFGLPFPVGPS